MPGDFIFGGEELNRGLMSGAKVTKVSLARDARGIFFLLGARIVGNTKVSVKN